MKKAILFSAILGSVLLSGSYKSTIARANSQATGTSSTQTINTSSNNSETDNDPVEYNVGTVNQAIAEASNGENITNSNDNQEIMLFSAYKRPNSITDYKKLGYKHITYSKWSGTHNYASTRAKRIAKFTVEQLASLIPGGGIKAAVGIYDVSELLKTQRADIFPTYNIRLISATAPRGNRAIIGQESIVKYYSNSKRTKLIKTIHHTSWVG